jgi:phosphoesterase RecJ-like protein
MSDALHREIRSRIQAAQRILVVTHIRPDGDAIGSLLGLGLALRQAGKSVQMVCGDGIPMAFRHLPGSAEVVSKPSGQFDLTAVVDCSDLNRVGNALNGYNVPDLNVDHHVTNLRFARLNLVEPDAVATSEILARHLDAWGLLLTAEVAAPLLTGLITDTLGFRTANVRPETLRLAARLMETGIDLSQLYMRSMVLRSFEAVRFWGAGLSRLERDDSLVWATLTLADRQASGYSGRDDADLINILSAIAGAEIALVFVEQPDGNVKISWRSQPEHDVSRVAMLFGGGGHPSAAGAEVKGSLEEVREKVLFETKKLLQQRS